MKISIQSYNESAMSITSIADRIMDTVRQNINYKDDDVKYDIAITIDLTKSNAS